MVAEGGAMGDRSDYATFTARRKAREEGPKKTEATGLVHWRRPEDKRPAERKAERILNLDAQAEEDARKAEERAAQRTEREAWSRAILDACED
jgi:hypothetical protein